MNIYVDLTAHFNKGRLRAILSSGQAVVLHRLAVMSKDGDWIIREDDETTDHILQCLDRMGARYRFGAPLDKKWLSGGWSSHFEFPSGPMRVRTDFVSRPPRISALRLQQIWAEMKDKDPPFVSLEDLAELKKTNREKDYAVLGELARKMSSLESTVRFSRSARDIIDIARSHRDLVIDILRERGIDPESVKSVDALETALDAERRKLMHSNERRLNRYLVAAQEWSGRWKEVEREIRELPLIKAHGIIVERTANVLPCTIPGDAIND